MSNYLDTRDLLDELVYFREVVLDDQQDEMDDDDRERLAALEELADEIGETTMRDGETMIPEDEFEDYARDLASEIGAIDDDAGWPARCIDWKQAAWELSMDYSLVTFDGTDYYVRLG